MDDELPLWYGSLCIFLTASSGFGFSSNLNDEILQEQPLGAQTQRTMYKSYPLSER